MKLGLLLALAVAAFVPHLSESRIISRCELKQKLQQALTVTKANGKNYDQIIALGEDNQWILQLESFSSELYSL